MKAMPHTVGTFFLILLAAFCSPISGGEQPMEKSLRQEQIEADWLLQERGRAKGNTAGKITPEEDAVGGCDGVKDGKNVGYYGFHTNQQDKPWWQVDLGTPQKLGRTVIYNGSTPADAKRALGLCVLVSNDAKQWTEVYRHDRSMFYGPKQPLTVPLDGVEARHVRVQLPYVECLHLDEIEVYAAQSDRNLALHRPATQSSISQWSRRESPAASAGAAKYLAHARDRLKLARKTLEFVQWTSPRPEMAKELEVLEERLAASVAVAPGAAASKELFHAAAELRRRIIFSHPLLDFDRVVFTKRPPPILCAPGDNYYAINNGIGPGLTVLDGWKSEKPVETVLLEDRLPPGCMMHPDVSFDGKRVVFAYCDHAPRREERQFFLYEAELDGTGLRQLTGGPRDRREGLQGRMTVVTEDYDPCYLPDGGIAFISTRNQGGVRCHWGGRYCPTYLLYRCDSDGSHIRPISFGEANEWDPVVMPDGQILWTRWDYVNRPVLQSMGLWTIRPDGTAPAHYFGNYTSNPMKICQARPIPGSSKIVATTAAHHAMQAGSLILIDRRLAEDGLEAITRLTPEATFPESEPTSPVAFSTPYPLSEDLFLAAYSPSPLPASMSQKPARNAFGIYLIDSLGGRELIYRDEEISCLAPLPVRPRAKPPVLPSSLETVADTPATGIFYIQDVNQSTQPIKPGTIKSIRVNELLLQPTQRAPRSSVVTYELLKRVIGTVPVEPDGSAIFEAPAGIPMQFQALDENGMAVLTMRTITQLQPGEFAGCVGCHEPRTSTPVARQSKPSKTPRPLTPPEGPRYEGGLSFAKTVQPVLDRYCIDCHGLGLKEKSKISLLGTTAAPGDLDKTLASMHASQAYHALARAPYIKIAQYGQESWYSVPKDYFAHAGTLVPMLLEGHEKVQLDRSSLQRIIDWADLNAQFSGTYSWNKDEWREIDGDAERLLRDHIRDTFGEELAKQPFAALVNVAIPSESRILKAPLAVSAGGWGQIDQGRWKSTDDPGYQRMHALVRKTIKPSPYQDIAGTCGRNEGCLCLSCWVRKLKEDREKLPAGKK